MTLEDKIAFGFIALLFQLITCRFFFKLGVLRAASVLIRLGVDVDVYDWPATRDCIEAVVKESKRLP